MHRCPSAWRPPRGRVMAQDAVRDGMLPNAPRTASRISLSDAQIRPWRAGDDPVITRSISYA